MCNACWAKARRRENQAEAESAAKRARVAVPLAGQAARKLLLERLAEVLDLLERLGTSSMGLSIATLTDPSKASLAVQRNWEVLQTIKAMRAAFVKLVVEDGAAGSK